MSIPNLLREKDIFSLAITHTMLCIYKMSKANLLSSSKMPYSKETRIPDVSPAYQYYKFSLQREFQVNTALEASKGLPSGHPNLKRDIGWQSTIILEMLIKQTKFINFDHNDIELCFSTSYDDQSCEFTTHYEALPAYKTGPAGEWLSFTMHHFFSSFISTPFKTTINADCRSGAHGHVEYTADDFFLSAKNMVLRYGINDDTLRQHLNYLSHLLGRYSGERYIPVHKLN